MVNNHLAYKLVGDILTTGTKSWEPILQVLKPVAPSSHQLRYVLPLSQLPRRDRWIRWRIPHPCPVKMRGICARVIHWLGGWTNHIWKIWSSKWVHFPPTFRGENSKHLFWVATTVNSFNLWPFFWYPIWRSPLQPLIEPGQVFTHHPQKSHFFAEIHLRSVPGTWWSSFSSGILGKTAWHKR